MDVGAVVVGLPDLHHRAAHRVSAGIEHAARDPHDLAHGRRDGVVDHEQVVVLVERQAVRIVGSDRQGGRSA